MALEGFRRLISMAASIAGSQYPLIRVSREKRFVKSSASLCAWINLPDLASASAAKISTSRVEASANADEIALRA
jgi:hypothetical protein